MADCCLTTGKIKHPDRAAANRQLRSLRAYGSYNGTPYRCNACKFWHVGVRKPTHPRDVGRHKG